MAQMADAAQKLGNTPADGGSVLVLRGWLPRDANEAAWQQRWFSLSVSLLGPGAASPRYRALTGQPVDPADIIGTVLTPANAINGGPVPILNTSTGVVSVPPGTPAKSSGIGCR